MNLCLRYGNEGSQYISPGNAEDFVRRVNGERPCDLAGRQVDWPKPYQSALPLIQKWLDETSKGDTR